MPEQRNYRFAANELQVDTPGAYLTGKTQPTSPEAAGLDAIKEIKKAPSKAIENLTEQARQIASNKQELISKIIKPMKGLDDSRPSGVAKSPAEIYADKVLSIIMAGSSIPENEAIQMILEVWPVWQANGNTWDTFINFIHRAATSFKSPSELIKWSKQLFSSMQDGAPVFTPEYIMQVALKAIDTKDFTEYQNLLLSLPFYKAVWSKQPVDTSSIAKSVTQISTMMEATRTPTQDMDLALQLMIAKNNLVNAIYPFYKELLNWIQILDVKKINDATKDMRGRHFNTGRIFQYFVEIEMQKGALKEYLGKAMQGLGLNSEKPSTKGGSSHKLFKTVLAAPPSGAAGGGTSATSPSSGTAGGGTSTSPPLSLAEQQAINEGMDITRKSLLIDKRQEIINNNINHIDNISEQKTKGLSGENLELFSSFVNSGNVVQKIDATIGLIRDQFKDADDVINTTEKWIQKHRINASSHKDVKAQNDTLLMNQMKYRTLKQDLNKTSIALHIQKIVLPKELEYFELKQSYDTNTAQLEAPVSALMVNSLVTTRNPRTGKLNTVNQRITRPKAIKNVWETGKKIVNLLIQISQELQRGANNTELGQSMSKNATKYYQAAIKQEAANNTMLMKYLSNIGLGQVNYTPVDVGKK